MRAIDNDFQEIMKQVIDSTTLPSNNENSGIDPTEQSPNDRTLLRFPSLELPLLSTPASSYPMERNTNATVLATTSLYHKENENWNFGTNLTSQELIDLLDEVERVISTDVFLDMEQQ